ncbi:MAG: hypothetical protein SGJ18_06925 [Pseudomonadota bacterium]|nr:hypothetical protein [Pseudomonadota bacterium]
MRNTKKLLLTIVLFGLSLKSQALVLDFSGNYRLEGFQMQNAELDSIRRDTSYILHHLYLKPKIIAADGLNIYSRFDLFNNANYPNSQMGQTFGQSPGLGTASPTPTTNDSNSNVLTQNQKDEDFVATELYLSAISEYGQFIAGRKMFGFGLGISHNAGQGAFDHWFDSKDMLSFTMGLGNFNFTPIFAKVSESKYNLADDINEYMLDISYHNAETNIKFGILYESRVAAPSSNDAPKGTAPGDAYGGAINTRPDDWASQRLNLFYERNFETLRVGFEAATNTGSTGVQTTIEEVTINSVGLALELDYTPKGSKWGWSLHSVYASGDDPSTDGKYEGFIFDKNYDVAMLLGNRVLGQANIFRTNLARNASVPTVAGDTSASAFADEEALSNVLILAPQAIYHWKPNLDLGFLVAFGQLNTEPLVGNDTDTDLGYEFDVWLNYKPHDRLTWYNGMGFLFPGKAFAGGTNNFDTEISFALTTKAAISF